MATKQTIADAAAQLAKRDRVLKRMLRDHGVPDLHPPRPRRPHFAQLARMICYQQLAGRAAAAIHGRFEALFDGPPTPEAVLALPFEKLRGAGLSNAKATSIRDLAEKVEAGLVELDRVARLSDEKVVSELTLVRGIGVWTAHMFLMFQMAGSTCGRRSTTASAPGSAGCSTSTRCRRRSSSSPSAIRSGRTAPWSLGTAGGRPIPLLPSDAGRVEIRSHRASPHR
jgi:hypothetical protein